MFRLLLIVILSLLFSSLMITWRGTAYCNVLLNGHVIFRLVKIEPNSEKVYPSSLAGLNHHLSVTHIVVSGGNLIGFVDKHANFANNAEDYPNASSSRTRLILLLLFIINIIVTLFVGRGGKRWGPRQREGVKHTGCK